MIDSLDRVTLWHAPTLYKNCETHQAHKAPQIEEYRKETSKRNKERQTSDTATKESPTRCANFTDDHEWTVLIDTRRRIFHTAARHPNAKTEKSPKPASEWQTQPRAWEWRQRNRRLSKLVFNACPHVDTQPWIGAANLSNHNKQRSRMRRQQDKTSRTFETDRNQKTYVLHNTEELSVNGLQLWFLGQSKRSISS